MSTRLLYYLGIQTNKKTKSIVSYDRIGDIFYKNICIKTTWGDFVHWGDRVDMVLYS